jgi:DNA (cytosine-5)-methyltransferase 1
MSPLVIDDFAGPGGWDEGVRPLGLTPLGIEHNADACATAAAAGHARIRADVRVVDLRYLGPVAGTIGSPPCPGWTVAGTGGARRDAVHVLRELAAVRTLADLDALITRLAASMGHPETLLALEPLRRALSCAPGWVAWEQVREVQPLWDACAVILRAHGYTVATGVVSAEQYGVPQTRRRAVLLARGPELSTTLGEARLPAPTHSVFDAHTPARLDAGVKPWVTIADALDVPGAAALRSNYGTGGDARRRGVRAVTQPAATVTGRVNRNRWQAADGTDLGPVTMAQAAVLQTFPADYPWQGTGTARLQQVGDAVPPLLARVLVSEVTGIPDPLR